MPIYEFACPACGHRTSLFVRQVGPPATAPQCPACNRPLSRLYSPFLYRRSIQDVHAWSGDPDKPGPDYHKDPRNIGRWVEKRFQEMGMELPDSVRETIKAAREGELPGAAKELQPNISEA